MNVLFGRPVEVMHTALLVEKTTGGVASQRCMAETDFFYFIAGVEKKGKAETT
jgi:hypothetical protein